MTDVSSRLETVSDDVDFGEGVVALPDGRIAFTEVTATAITVTDGSTAKRIATVPGAPNGMALGPDRALYVANNGGIGPERQHGMWVAPEPINGQIQRVTLAGEISVVAQDLPGPAPHRPNDLCFGPDGGLWFTDSGNWEVFFTEQSDFRTPPPSYRGGALFYRGADGTVSKAVAIEGFPNGLAFTPDGTELVVAQTVLQRLLVFPVKPGGVVGEPRLLTQLPDWLLPDGMCFADDGTLFVAGAIGDAIGGGGARRRTHRCLGDRESIGSDECLPVRWRIVDYPGYRAKTVSARGRSSATATPCLYRLNCPQIATTTARGARIMHVGMGVFFQGLESGRDDHDVVRGGLSLADQAEPRGFESIWTAEHHFTRYHMMPNPAQLLTYLAGRTTSVRLGTMVMVLPWHDPVRVAEEIAWLDSVSRGRVVLGFGRGLGSIEFDGFRVKMGESRQRFVEYATAISAAFESGAIDYDGDIYRQPRAELHPPAFTTFRGRTYASAVSPESAKIMARLRYGLMLIAQKPWKVTVEETAAYRELYREINGEEPPAPVLVNFTTVDTDRGRARELHEHYTMAYARSTIDHYEFTNERLEHVEGYEYYAGLRANINKHGLGQFNRFLADLQMGGTPDELVEQTVERVRALGAGGVVNIFGFGGMSQDVAQRTFDVYSEHVLPRLKKIDAHREICAPLPDLDPAPVH